MRWIGGHASGHDVSSQVQENLKTSFFAAAAVMKNTLPQIMGKRVKDDDKKSGNPKSASDQQKLAPGSAGNGKI